MVVVMVAAHSGEKRRAWVGEGSRRKEGRREGCCRRLLHIRNVLLHLLVALSPPSSVRLRALESRFHPHPPSPSPRPGPVIARVYSV